MEPFGGGTLPRGRPPGRAAGKRTRAPAAVQGDRPTEPMYYGLGWAIDATGSGDRLHHSGSNGTGFRCYCEFDPRRGTGLVIMANAVGGMQLWREIVATVGNP